MMPPPHARWQRTIHAGVALMFSALAAQVPAQSNAPVTAADPALEARVKALSSELRCLVCQNQTVADSDAPVAQDLRAQVRAQLAAGKSEAEIKQYMTDRFGDFVLYKPPFKASTLALWLSPFVALLVVGGLLWRRVARAGRPSTESAEPLTAADRARAQALLAGHEDTVTQSVREEARS